MSALVIRDIGQYLRDARFGSLADIEAPPRMSALLRDWLSLFASVSVRIDFCKFGPE